MKIERGNTNAWRLASISIGSLFEYEHIFYIKTSELINEERLCVRLGDGGIDYFPEEVFVYKREAKVVIE